MKLATLSRKLPINKFSVTAVAVGIVAGSVITASSVTNTHSLDLGKKTDATTSNTSGSDANTGSVTGTITPPAPDAQSSTDPSNPLPTGGNTTNGVDQNQAQAANSSQSQASVIVPPAPTVTDTEQTTSPNVDNPDFTDYTCTYTWSDGTTTTKFAGRASNADIAKFDIRFGCPPAQ